MGKKYFVVIYIILAIIIVFLFSISNQLSELRQLLMNQHGDTVNRLDGIMSWLYMNIPTG